MKLHNEAAKLANKIDTEIHEAFKAGDFDRHHRLCKVNEKVYARQFRRFEQFIASSEDYV